MKTFTFRLQTVLDFRAREEEQAQDAFAQSLHARARIESGLRQARATIEAYHSALHSSREGVSDRQHQLVFLNALRHQEEHCTRLTAELAAAEREVCARREAMLGAHRRCEALTRLKEKQQSAHSAEAARIEESMIGDLITARHALGMMEAAA